MIEIFDQAYRKIRLFRQTLEKYKDQLDDKTLTQILNEICKVDTIVQEIDRELRMPQFDEKKIYY
jgi:hypothetical protein